MGPLKLLTVADVAERCQLGETAARDLLRAAGGVKLGKLWRIAEVDLLRYIGATPAPAERLRQGST